MRTTALCPAAGPTTAGGFLVLLVGPALDAYPFGWGIVAGTLVAAPWFVSAYIETHRAVPAYPAEWKVFDSG